MVPNILIRKPIALLKAEAEETEVQALVAHGGVPLKRTLSAWSLVSLGIGCVIGAGIFVLTGHAAATNAGPAIALSFVFGGIACAFAGLCYAEMASTVPIRGERIHLCLCDHGRIHRLDDRLGPDPRICAWRNDSRHRLVGLRRELSARPRHPDLGPICDLATCL